MDSLFDDVARILARPQPRRRAIGLVLRTAAGAAAAALLPGRALAWEKCGNTLCEPGLICCNDTTSTCCKSSDCLAPGPAGVCEPNGNTCSPACAAGQMCCHTGPGGIDVCCSPPGPFGGGCDASSPTGCGLPPG
jgi:hypothetical protein